MTTGTTDNFEKMDKKRAHTVAFFVVSLVTVLLALLSMVTANQLSTLQTRHQERLFETTVSDAESKKNMQAELISTAKALMKEKKRNDELKKKLSAATKELKMVKVDLNNAQKKIDDLQTETEKVPISIEQSPSTERTDETISTSKANG
jgi:hypothetical protein